MTVALTSHSLSIAWYALLTMPLSFQPACFPVSPGNLPHGNPTQALSVLLHKTPEVPTWPQLPRRSLREQGYVQSAIGFPGLVLDEMSEQVYVERARAFQDVDQLALAYLQNTFTFGALTAEDAPGLIELRRSLAQGLHSLAVKSQLFGPISLGLQLTDEEQRPLIYDPMLMEALAQFLTLRAAWQVDQLTGLVPDVIVCLDEPFLDAFNVALLPVDWDQGAEWLELVFAGISGCRGLATRGAVNWALVLETSVECIHFDAYTSGATLLEAAGKLSDFLARSGTVIWGLIPADKEALTHETRETLCTRFEGFLNDLAAAGVSRERMIEASLISTNGGLAHLPVEIAEHALDMCVEVSSEIRSIYHLE